ncbi:MAG: GDSL-type esterase/lipase family protein [Planctomycetia bacterium]
MTRRTWAWIGVTVTVAVTTASAADDPWRLSAPPWSSKTVDGESVLFVRETEGAPATARLLRTPTKIVNVRRADRAMEFVEGKDYSVDAATGVLSVVDGSRLPSLTAADLFPPAGSPRGIASKTGDPSRAVLFDNAHWFHDQQVEVSYETAEPWTGYAPKLAAESLAGTLKKLRAKEKITVAVSGDSISTGLNTSGTAGVAPNQPDYPRLVAEGLRAAYGGDVALVNRSVSGWRVENGLKDLDALLECKPDLVIVAYGMNHYGARDAVGFAAKVRTMIDRIQSADPATEIILVAPMHGNHQWVHTPPDQFAPHRDRLAEMAGPKVALADLTELWSDLLKRKRDADLTGNGVNHPNDFGHRLYAQVVLGLLVENPKGD